MPSDGRIDGPIAALVVRFGAGHQHTASKNIDVQPVMGRALVDRRCLSVFRELRSQMMKSLMRYRPAVQTMRRRKRAEPRGWRAVY
jgi:hypothetical protein